MTTTGSQAANPSSPARPLAARDKQLRDCSPESLQSYARLSVARKQVSTKWRHAALLVTASAPQMNSPFSSFTSCEDVRWTRLIQRTRGKSFRPIPAAEVRGALPEAEFLQSIDKSRGVMLASDYADSFCRLMADNEYIFSVARAVAELDHYAGASRRALYQRMRTELATQLRKRDPPLSESAITQERLALEEAIRRVEANALRQLRSRITPLGAVSPSSRKR
jgi:hypothetical protein